MCTESRLTRDFTDLSIAFQLQDMVDYEMVDFEASHDRDVKEMLKISDSMSDKLAFTVNESCFGDIRIRAILSMGI